MKGMVGNFACLRKDIKPYLNLIGHKAHKACIVKYSKSDHAKNSNYYCPQQCTDVGIWLIYMMISFINKTLIITLQAGYTHPVT